MGVVDVAFGEEAGVLVFEVVALPFPLPPPPPLFFDATAAGTIFVSLERLWREDSVDSDLSRLRFLRRLRLCSRLRSCGVASSCEDGHCCVIAERAVDMIGEIHGRG